MNGKSARIPVYDFKTNARVPGEFTMIYPSDVVVVEGILVFYFPGIRLEPKCRYCFRANKELFRDKFNLKLFVDTDADTRLARRVLRDISERGRDLEHVLHQYTTLVKVRSSPCEDDDDSNNDDDDCPARVRGVLYPHQEVRRRDHPERSGERRRSGSHQTAHRGDVHEA